MLTTPSASAPLDGFVLPPVLQLADLARALRLSLSSVLRLHRLGVLPLANLDGRYCITRQRFQAWLDAQTVLPDPSRRTRKGMAGSGDARDGGAGGIGGGS